MFIMLTEWVAYDFQVNKIVILIFTVLNSFKEQCSGEWKQDGATHQLKNSSPGTIGII
jgi:hypothetical protein